MSEGARVTAKTTGANRENLVSQANKPNFSQSINSPVEQIFFLQRTVGNQSVERLLKSGVIRAKLTIGQPGDIYEQEADKVAEQVMRMPEPNVSNKEVVSGQTQLPYIQRVCTECEEELQRQPIDEEEKEEVLHMQPVEEEGEVLQTKKASDQSFEITSELESGIYGNRGKGQPLRESSRSFFEPRFGYDFSHVRVHTGSESDSLSRSLNARAFTTGHDIFFRNGEYNPYSSGGRELLAHELTHVAQQTSQAFSIQRAIHKGSENFPDSEHCFSTPANKPILEKTVAIIEAEMIVPDSCSGEVTLRTNLKDVVPGGATGWGGIKFGSSDGTGFGSAKSPSGVTKDTVYFEEKIPLMGCLLDLEIYHYVRYFEGKNQYTLVEVRFNLSVSPDKFGIYAIDASPAPTLRVEPCGGIKPPK